MKSMSIGFHPNKAKQNQITKKTPIYLRLIIDGQKKEVRLKNDFDLTEYDLNRWNYANQRIETKDSDVNDYLGAISTRCRLLKLEMITKSISYSINEIVDKILLRVETIKEPIVYDCAKLFFREEVENSAKKEGTLKNYKNAINQLCTYLEVNNLKNITFPQFTKEIADGFKKYLESPHDKLPLKKINTIVSSSTKIKNVKPIFEKAIDKGLIIRNPFSKMKLTFKGGEAEALNIYQVKRIYDLEFKNDTGLQFTRDFFILMSFTGLSYIDAIELSINEFEVTNDEMLLLGTTRNKTGRPIAQFISRYAQEIINKYLKNGFSEERINVFYKESGESINRKLKIIGHLANIPFSLSTKNARITLKKLLKEADIKDFFLTRKIMGWSNSKFIEDVYDRFTESDYLNAKNCLDLYLDKHLKCIELKENVIN